MKNIGLAIFVILLLVGCENNRNLKTHSMKHKFLRVTLNIFKTW
ncbi:MAG: hypothetical protein CM15mP98_07900 [Paracoccaceae bacterium]|nr:MAG: hypothetical protein CM15mP98_07900 [Paracoccaceae bacterium]